MEKIPKNYIDSEFTIHAHAILHSSGLFFDESDSAIASEAVKATVIWKSAMAQYVTKNAKREADFYRPDAQCDDLTDLQWRHGATLYQ